MGSSKDANRPPKRRARGYYQDTKGQWWAYISQNGKQYDYRCASEASARAKRRELEQQKDAKVSIPGGKIKLHDWLEHWLNTIVAPTKKPKTLRFYRQMCEFYISPRIGHIKLESLDADAIRAMLADLKAGGFAERTVRHAYTVLRTALTQAMGDRRLNYNPILSVAAPEVHDEKPEPLTEQEAAALCAAVEAHRLYALYILAIELGIRKGELLGLEIAGLDLEARTIRVRQQVQSIDAPPMIVEYTKNDKIRTLPLTTRQCDILRVRLVQLVAEGTQAIGLLFPSEAGTPMSERNLDRHFKSALKSACLRDCKFHHLRHTCLSWLGDTGANKSVIQAVAGHADADVTDLYVKIKVSAMREALEELERRCVLRRAA